MEPTGLTGDRREMHGRIFEPAKVYGKARQQKIYYDEDCLILKIKLFRDKPVPAPEARGSGDTPRRLFFDYTFFWPVKRKYESKHRIEKLNMNKYK